MTQAAPAFSLTEGQTHQQSSGEQPRSPATAEMIFLAFQSRPVVPTPPSPALTHSRQGIEQASAPPEAGSEIQNQCSGNTALAH